MNLQEILDLRTQNLRFDLDDSYGESPTAQQQVDSVNWAIRTISKHIIQFNPKITFTLTAGTAIYDLRDTNVVSSKVIKPYQVVINGNILWNAGHSEYGLWTLAELERSNPSWRTASNSTPTKAVYYGNGKILLNPPPTAEIVSAGNNYVSGQYLAADMTTGQTASSPDLPVELHESVAYLAAVKSAIPYVTEQEGWQRLQAFNAEWKAVADEVRQENKVALVSWGSTSGYAYDDFIWM